MSLYVKGRGCTYERYSLKPFSSFFGIVPPSYHTNTSPEQVAMHVCDWAVPVSGLAANRGLIRHIVVPQLGSAPMSVRYRPEVCDYLNVGVGGRGEEIYLTLKGKPSNKEEGMWATGLYKAHINTAVAMKIMIKCQEESHIRIASMQLNGRIR